jgi:hypothetical protein
MLVHQRVALLLQRRPVFSLKLAHVGCVSRRNSLYFVYTPMPHVIVGAQMDGASEKLYSTTFRPLQRILDLRFETMSWRPFSQWEIHGNPLETGESIYIIYIYYIIYMCVFYFLGGFWISSKVLRKSHHIFRFEALLRLL